jgi:focal adhesion kinase 1
MHPKPVDHSLKVLLANGTANQIRFNDQTDFASVISLITNRLSAEPVDRPLQSLYALRLCLSDPLTSGASSSSSPSSPVNNHVWLGRHSSVIATFDHFALQSSDAKVELRVRYFAFPFKEIFHKDRVTFYYLYDQVRSIVKDVEF